jgi:phage-related protein (TIGR01555 family)
MGAAEKMKNMVARFTTDGWANALTGLGDALRDKRMSATVAPPVVLNQRDLDNLYEGTALARAIVDLPANEMVREWISITSDDEDATRAVLQTLDTLDAQARLFDALSWERLHGGAVIVMGIDDGLDAEKPVNESGIKAVRFLNALDRWDVVQDPKDQECYRVLDAGLDPGTLTASTLGSRGRRVHKSRVLSFGGLPVSRRTRAKQWGWGNSVFIGAYESLRDLCSTWDSSAVLMQDFAQAIFELDGLSEAMAAGEDSLVKDRLMLMDFARSVLRAVVINKGEQFERKTTSVAGLPEMLDRFTLRLSADTRIPVTLLMGQSPAGLNATGDNDVRN